MEIRFFFFLKFVANILIVQDNHIKSRLSLKKLFIKRFFLLSSFPPFSLLGERLMHQCRANKNSLILLHSKCSFTALIYVAVRCNSMPLRSSNFAVRVSNWTRGMLGVFFDFLIQNLRTPKCIGYFASGSVMLWGSLDLTKSVGTNSVKVSSLKLLSVNFTVITPNTDVVPTQRVFTTFLSLNEFHPNLGIQTPNQ